MKSFTYTQLNEQAGRLNIEIAPKYCDILITDFNNTDARSSNSISFNITTTGGIPSSIKKGEVRVHFPDEYVLESSEITCRTSSIWSGGLPICYIDHNMVRLIADVADLAGNLKITLSNVPNPLSELNSHSIDVQVYDDYNRVLTMSSFVNLNPNRHQFLYPGPLILINKDEPFLVQSGSMSELISITLDYPCALNLTLTPYSRGFTFIPTSIDISTGDVYNDFRVSVPQNTRDKEYVII